MFCFWQIHFTIGTNTFGILDKYISKFEKIHFNWRCDCGEMYLLGISGHLCTLRRERLTRWVEKATYWDCATAKVCNVFLSTVLSTYYFSLYFQYTTFQCSANCNLHCTAVLYRSTELLSRNVYLEARCNCATVSSSWPMNIAQWMFDFSSRYHKSLLPKRSFSNSVLNYLWFMFESLTMCKNWNLDQNISNEASNLWEFIVIIIITWGMCRCANWHVVSRR